MFFVGLVGGGRGEVTEEPVVLLVVFKGFEKFWGMFFPFVFLQFDDFVAIGCDVNKSLFHLFDC